VWTTVFLSLLFFGSGFSGLVYEVTWSRMLTLVFGDTVVAVSTVLAAFMAGLALGSWLAGRTIDARHNTLGIYACLELGLGLSVGLVVLAWLGMQPVYVWLYRQWHTVPILFGAWRFLLGFLVLLLPTMLMGATLPVLSRACVQRQERLGWHVGLLYGSNTAGAVLGCVAAGFWLIGHLGMYQTLAIGATINLLVALLAWALQRRLVPQPAAPVARPESGAAVRGALPWLILLVAAGSGFAALGYEVLWTRALVFFVGNSTYAFSIMLATFLCGLAVGSLLLARLADRTRRPLVLLGWLQVSIGFAALLTVPLLGLVLYRLGDTWQAFASAYWGGPLWLKFAKTFGVMFVPTLLMGCTFPLLTTLYTPEVRRVGHGVGTVYAVNTLGALAGALVAGFVCLPLLGLRQSVLLLSAVNVLLGVLVLVRQQTVRRPFRVALAAGLLAVLVTTGWVAPSLRFKDIAGIVEAEELFYDEDAAGIVKVYRDANGRKVISVNGWPVAGSAGPDDIDYPEIQKALGHLPMLLHAQPRRVLVIGFGAGGTSWAVSRYDVEEIDCVELVPGVLRAAPYLAEVNHTILADARFRVSLNDGRHHLLVTAKTYDVITIDATDPKFAGSANLYTREFYQLGYDRLSADGLLVQWLPYHQVSNATMKVIMKTFQQVFPHTSLWYTRFKEYAILVGSRRPLHIDLARLEQRLRDPRVQADLQEVYSTAPLTVLEGFAMGAASVRQFVQQTTQLNTYNHPVSEFFGLRWHNPAYENLWELSQYQDDPLEIIVGIQNWPTAQRQAFQSAMQRQRRKAALVTQGLLFEQRGMLQEAVRFYRRALHLVPEDDGVAFLLRAAPVHEHEALQTLAGNPDDIPAYQRLAYLYWTRQQYDASIASLQELLRRRPWHLEAYVYLALNYEAQGRYDAAMTAYEQAFETNPTQEAAVRFGERMDTLQLRQRLATSPDDADGQLQLGYVHWQSGQHELAIAALEQAVRLAPQRFVAHFNLGINYEAIQRDDLALAAYERALQLDPQHAYARNHVDKLRLKLALAAQQPATVRLVNGADLRIHPLQADTVFQLGLRHLIAEEYDAAVAAFRRAIDLDTTHVMAHINLGVSYVALELYDKAEATYRHVLRHLDARSERAYNYLGTVYWRRGLPQQAVRYYRKALELRPDFGLAYANLGSSYEDLGRFEAAVTAYQQALRHDATLQFAKERLRALSLRGAAAGSQKPTDGEPGR
jgi:spermidine synthase